MIDTRLSDLDSFITTANAVAHEGMAHFEKINSGSAEAMALLLCGRLDYTLRCALFVLKFQCNPEVVRDLMMSDITLALELFKDDMRSNVMEHINRSAQSERRSKKSEQQLQFEKTAMQFRAMSEPSPEGTVAELARLHGVSKSHVRLLKRENRLHELNRQ